MVCSSIVPPRVTVTGIRFRISARVALVPSAFHCQTKNSHCSLGTPMVAFRRINRVSTGRCLPPAPGSWKNVLKNRVPTGKSQASRVLELIFCPSGKIAKRALPRPLLHSS
jgi:hypothetical protein